MLQTVTTDADQVRTEEWVRLYRRRNPAAGRWAAGYGPIQHSLETQARVFAMAELLAARGVKGDGLPLFDVLYAADRISSAAMWLVVHQTYAQNVYLDGRDLAPPHRLGERERVLHRYAAGSCGARCATSSGASSTRATPSTAARSTTWSGCSS
jgi:hypothetical protein